VDHAKTQSRKAAKKKKHHGARRAPESIQRRAHEAIRISTFSRLFYFASLREGSFLHNSPTAATQEANSDLKVALHLDRQRQLFYDADPRYQAVFGGM